MGQATLHITRLRVLRRGWGQPEQLGADSEIDLTEIELTETLDLDDEDAEAGLPDGRKRPN